MIWWLKLTCPVVILVKAGKVTCLKGRLASRTLREIQALLADEGIQSGQISMQGNGRFGFSSSIPKTHHQRLRNILASA